MMTDTPSTTRTRGRADDGAPTLHDSHDTEATPAHVRSDLLLRGQRVVKIEHNGALYELRATRLGKLILTK